MMKDRLLQILAQLKAANFATKVTIAFSVLLLAGMVGIASWRANVPHFVLLESGLDATQASMLEAALAGENIRYEISQPPGPYVVRVDESEVYAARNAAALAGFRTPEPKGVNPGAAGASNVFLAGSERAQMIAKRQWQEMEKQLEAFDFVSTANVQGNTQGSGLLRRPGEDTYSVVVQVRGGRQLTYSEGSNIARVVSHGFGASPENVVVTDQNGHMAWAGGEDGGPGGTKDVFRHKQEADRYRTQWMQDYFDRTIGPGLVNVLVTTEWTSDYVERFSEKPGKGVAISESSEESSTPSGGGGSVGGVAGVGTNLQDFGNGNAGMPNGAGGGNSAPASEATTKSRSTRNAVGMDLEHRVANSPVLKRIDVAVTIDESLADRKQDIEALTRSMVPLGELDGDVLGSVAIAVAPLASIERDEEGKPIPPTDVEPLEAPNPMIELVIEYGLEALAALAFLFVMLRSLKGVRSALAEAAENAIPKEPVAARVAVGEGGGLIATTAEGEAITDREIDLEAVARAQIEDLLRSDPERISEILTRWASGETVESGV